MSLCFFWVVTVVAGIFFLYYAAITSGLYRDPLMGQLQRYGEESRPCLLCRLLLAGSAFSLGVGTLLSSITHTSNLLVRLLPPAIPNVLAVVLLLGSVVAWQTPTLRESLPRWYVHLLRTTTRQERRQIAYAWQRIPRLLRWRLSGDQASFVVWSELVRLTVIYGAFDPNSPWDMWY